VGYRFGGECGGVGVCRGVGRDVGGVCDHVVFVGLGGGEAGIDSAMCSSTL
jgi:hypothetical protein